MGVPNVAQEHTEREVKAIAEFLKDTRLLINVRYQLVERVWMQLLWCHQPVTYGIVRHMIVQVFDFAMKAGKALRLGDLFQHTFNKKQTPHLAWRKEVGFGLVRA